MSSSSAIDTPRSHRLGGRIKRDAWWIVPSMALALALTVTSGFWVLPILAAFNNFGVWFYDDHGHGPRRTTLVLKVLAIPLLPVGLFALLTTDDGPRPTEGPGTGADDPAVIRAGAGQPTPGPPGLP